MMDTINDTSYSKDELMSGLVTKSAPILNSIMVVLWN